MRSVNGRGRQVKELLAWADGEFGAEPVNDRRFVSWRDEGDAFVEQLAGVIHGDADPSAIDDGRIRAWVGLGRETERALQRRYGAIGRRAQTSDTTEAGSIEAALRADRDPDG
jgi:hypothetical protein